MTDLLDIILGSRIYFGSAPVFLSSIFIYGGQWLTSNFLFRDVRLSLRLGYSSVLLIVSYATFELLFKLSFLLFGSSHFAYFLRYELYPTALFLAMIATALALADRLQKSRKFLLTLLVTSFTWAIWLVTSFPVEIQVYETNPSGLPLIFDFTAKLLTSLMLLTAIKRK